ncbi:hypothetical protein ABVT39_005231, partial [Epinephelus coioides]
MSKKKTNEANASSLANTQTVQAGEMAILRANETLRDELLAKMEEKADSAMINQLKRELQQATETAKPDNIGRA